MTYIFLQFYYVFMFEARYLMKWSLLHALFSHFLCVCLDISFFLRIILLLQFHFVARKIAVTLGQFHFLSANELPSSETRLISMSSGIVMTFALKTKMGKK